METESFEDTRTYKAVVNHEEQYSIWPADRANPPGWRDAGKSGTKQECLQYIGEVWTDMRPLSLRLQMEGAEANGRANS
jgi:MbtH protein